MTKKSFKLYIGAISLLAFSYPSMASKIDIVNENKKSLTVKVKGEGDDVTETLTTHVKEIPGDQLVASFICSRNPLFS